jgi:hypothetical protein
MLTTCRLSKRSTERIELLEEYQIAAEKKK